MGKDKEKFYLFLDIDGVLWDWPWRLSEIKRGNIKDGSLITHFHPESVSALNSLIAYINKQYDCNLVISSSWRRLFSTTISTLNKNKVALPTSVDSTPFAHFPHKRGKEIQTYLKGKENNSNFLIIDDKHHDFDKFFSPESIIKTSIYDESLRHHHVQNWIHSRESNKIDNFSYTDDYLR